MDEACTADDLATVTTFDSERAGKGMRPQMGENCVKDTKEQEEEELCMCYCHVNKLVHYLHVSKSRVRCNVRNNFTHIYLYMGSCTCYINNACRGYATRHVR